MSAEDTRDRRLDALALLTASLHHDDEGLGALLNASDDVEHWRGVASVLCGQLTAMMRPHDHEAYSAWQRQRILTDQVGDFGGAS